MYVCLSVHDRFTIEIYRFMHSVRTSLALATHDAIMMEIEVEDSEDRRQRKNESRCMEDGLTAQQKDERRQDNGDKKRLARQHRSDLLHSLTCKDTCLLESHHNTDSS